MSDEAQVAYTIQVLIQQAVKGLDHAPQDVVDDLNQAYALADLLRKRLEMIDG